MKAITVRQPWAWAIVHGGKDVENRSRNIAGDYRGPLAIHAGLTYSDDGHLELDRLTPGWDESGRRSWEPHPRTLTAVILGVVNLWAVHEARPGCCPNRGVRPFGGPWAMPDHWHLNLSNPRPLAEPIPWAGRLGLWNLPDDVVADALAAP